MKPSPAERLRARMWQARGSHSRGVGIVLLFTSGMLMAISYLTRYTLFEVSSIASFVFGLILLASELEPKVKLIPSAESQLGPLLAFSDVLKASRLDGKARFISSSDGVRMEFGTEAQDGNVATFQPLGKGLYDAYERELGPLKDRGKEFVETWLPRVLVDGLELAQDAKITVSDGMAETKIRGPYVRPLCVRHEVNERICRKVGCPLTSSISEALASSLAMEIEHGGCSYDPATQTSSSRHLIRVRVSSN